MRQHKMGLVKDISSQVPSLGQLLQHRVRRLDRVEFQLDSCVFRTPLNVLLQRDER